MLRCAPPHSVSSETPGVQQLTEDSLLFDGPRATYGRFRILHQIGAGSVGPVFRGEDSETRRAVVVKVIRVGLTPERVAVVGPALRALKERLVEHPALSPILETGVVDIEPFAVSPVIDGDSLDVALREYGPANMADAVPRLRALADALDAAAAVDVAHGSLHPRDIVVSVEATVLTGIGLAAVLERVGVRPPVRRPYCAPEVALGRGISPAGDQYSLAAIAHEWLSGRRVSSDGIQVPTSSPEGAAALAAVFAKAMAADPADRYPSATAFVEALAGVADAVMPRTRAARRKPVVTPPQLQFDAADEPPALTFAPLEAAPLVVPGQFFAPDDDLAGIEPAAHHVIGGEERVVADDYRDAPGAAMAGAVDDYAPVADHDLPLVTGPRDFGDHDEAPAYAAYDEAAAPTDTLSLPYADEPDEPAVVDAPADHDAASGPSWAKWGGIFVVGVLLVVGGGRALLRWGTPGSATTAATATSAAGAEGAPAAASTAPVGQRAAAEPPRPVAEPVRDAPASPPTTASSTGTPPAANRPASAAQPPPTSAAPAARATTPPAARAVTPPSRAAAVVPPARTPARPPASRPAARAAAPRPAAKVTPPAAAATVSPGRLLVRSTPSGAEVFVNGERRGVSPVAIRDLTLGAYTIRVQRAGFDPVEQRVVLEAARPARALEVVLTRSAPAPAAAPAGPTVGAAATTGSLLIESRPSGARAYVDGVEVGRTPVTVAAAAVGSRGVRIELPGYLVVSTSARVEPGARARVAVTLTAERPR